MAIKQINLEWISKKMESGKWYKINDSECLRQIQQLISNSFGYPKFTLTLSEDYKRVRKTEI